MKTTYQNLLANGWGPDEAKRRAEIIDAAKAGGKAIVSREGLTNGDQVAVQRDGRMSVGRVVDGVLVVDGCIPSGVILTIKSRPYRCQGGDYWRMRQGDVVAVLDDGTQVTRGQQVDGCYRVEAKGTEYASVMAAAVDLTPA